MRLCAHPRENGSRGRAQKLDRGVMRRAVKSANIHRYETRTPSLVLVTRLRPGAGLNQALAWDVAQNLPAPEREPLSFRAGRKSAYLV